MIAPPGRKLGKYEIRQKLGRGGMADVYLAQDTALGHPVALKLIEHSADADTRDAIDAERRGGELQRQLAEVDPHVVRVYELGDLEGFFYVAMEYIDGQDLAELMRRGPLAVEFAADVAISVAETLEHAHNLEIAIEGKNFQGIVHGDIKPKNIRIDARGDMRVLDFGIAKALSLSRRLTRNEFGSVPYASPERLDSGDVSALSDLWSLAVMLYEMVTGMQPYHADNTERLDRMIRSRIPPPPAPDPCPEPLRRILRKAMAPEPAARYQTARDLAEELTAFRKGEPVQAEAEDLDATRRTWRGPAAANDETRFTARPIRPPLKPAAKPKSLFGTAMRVVASLAVAVFLFGAGEAISSYFFYERGQKLERSIDAEQLTDLDEIWAKWTELSAGNPSSLLLHGPRKVVKRKFVEGADRVIAAYRNADSQPVFERDWERARVLLARALEVDPDDTVRGKLRLCEGHLARIRKQIPLAQEKFNEAQRLLGGSPDPELGLARLYVYGLRDIDKAYAALELAEKHGYHLGNREKTELADGYRDRADRLFWDSRNVRGLPQEKEQIARAADDYEHAISLYQEVAPYANAAAQIERVQTSLDSVNSRLAQIGH